ncbi:MAG: high-affinity nickel-transporter, partial [Chloroflexota bacterium]
PLAEQDRRMEFLPGQGGLETLRLTLQLTAALPSTATDWQADYQDANYPDRLGWSEVIVQPQSGIVLLESTAPMEDSSQELTSYPPDKMVTTNSALFRFKTGTAEEQAQTVVRDPAADNGSSLPGGQTDRFAELMTPEANPLGPGALLLTLLAAFGWGALHATTPGHGKTIVAAYLVGSRGTARHAVFLGLTTTVTHTLGVFALGLIVLLASQTILPETLYPWLSLVSGLLVAGIGYSLFRDRWRQWRGRNHDHEHPHDHDHDEHSHSHDGHSHSHNGHTHSLMPPGADGAPVTWRSLLALGVSGGLLPCPSALVVMLSAIALNRVGFGLILIVAFSLGLASVLTATGLLLVYAGRLFDRLPRVKQGVFKVMPVFSALFITAVGLVITIQAIRQPPIIQAILNLLFRIAQ